MHWILIIPEKPHIGPIVGHFWPQNFKNKFLLKKNISFNSKLLWWCNVMQKTQKRSMHWLLIWNINWNNVWLLGPFQDPFGPKTWNNIFTKKLFKSILSLYATMTSYKKRKISPLIFHKAGKTSFWVYFGRSFSPKTSKQDFSSQAPFIFKVNNTLTLCKKSENP